MAPNDPSRDTSRRTFFRNGASLALGAAAAPYLAGCATPSPKLGTIVGAGRFVASDKTRLILSSVDLDATTDRLRVFDIGFYGHGFVENPLDGRRAVVFEKRGAGACEVDMTTGKVLREIKTADDHHFYGHGSFTPDGATMFCTESILSKDYQGILAVRDGKSFASIGQVDTYGIRPHDCRMIDDGKVMVVANAGGPIKSSNRPNVTYVELASNKLLDKVEFESDMITAGHLDIAANGDLLCVSAPRHGVKDEVKKPGAFSVRRAGGGSTFTTMVDPGEITKKMIAETLSVAIHEPTATAATTNPYGNLITFWDLAKGTYKGKLEIEKPRGVSLTRDGSQFVCSYGKLNSALVRVDPNTVQEVPDSRIEETGITGSHLFLYEPRLA